MRAAILVSLLLTTVSCTEGLREGEEALRSAPSRSPSGSASATLPAAAPSGTAGSSAPGRPRIELERPQRDTEVLSPVLIRGTAVTASGRVTVRILDAAGMEIAAMDVDVSCGAECRGTFETQLAFFVPSAQAGTIQAAEDGSNAGGGDAISDQVSVQLIPGV